MDACVECSHVHDAAGECPDCIESAQLGQYAPCSGSCSTCGSVKTVELHSPDGNQSITICAGCGSDQ